jgi:hypothetical protein
MKKLSITVILFLFFALHGICQQPQKKDTLPCMILCADTSRMVLTNTGEEINVPRLFSYTYSISGYIIVNEKGATCSMWFHPNTNDCLDHKKKPLKKYVYMAIKKEN